MTPDTTHDTTDNVAHGATGDSLAFVVTITEAARLLGESVRTVQRKIDRGEYEAVPVAGKRCVRLRAAAMPAGATPDPSGIIESIAINDSRDATRDSRGDNKGDSTTLARLPGGSQSTAIIADVVSETLRQTGERRAPAVGIADKLLLTLAEAQALTGLSRSTLRVAIDAGTLPAKQIGRAWRIKRGDLESYIESL